MSKIKKVLLIILALLTSIGVVTTSILYFKGKKEQPLVNPSKKHKITFDGYTKDYEKEISHNNTVVAPKDKDMKKEGYLFLGWKEQGSEEFYDFSKPVTKDLVLIPQYHSLAVLDQAKEKLSETEKAKYTKDSVDKLQKIYDEVLAKVNDKNTSKTDKVASLILLDVTLKALEPVKKTDEPITPPAVEKVTVTFNVNGGTDIQSIQIEKGQKVTKPETDPTNEGHTFGGWYKEQTLENEFDFNSVIEQDTTIYAKWNEVKKYSVTFDVDGNTTQIVAIDVEEGKLATKPEDPQKQHHTFNGWYKDQEKMQMFDFATETITANITLYAKFELVKHSVTFNLNGGNIDGNSENVVKDITHDQLVTKLDKEPVKDGLVFKGWVADTSKPHELFDFENTKVTSDLVLTAYFEQAGLVVRFVIEDDVTFEGSSRVIVQENEEVQRPANDPVKENHSFDNWYKDESLTELFNFDEVITVDTKIYPKFTRTHAFVTYDLQGSQLEGQDLKVKVEVNKPTQQPQDPTKPNHTFKGWYKEAEGTNKFEFTENITKDITLFAIFEINNYQVDFNTDGGTNVDAQTINHGDKATKPQTNPTKDGHTFAKWVTEANGDTEFVFESPITSATTIYAKWVINRYQVTFNTGVDGLTVELQEVVYNQKATEPKEKPAREGYKFLGWYVSNQDDAVTFDFANTQITKDTEVFAKWEINKYTVTFNIDGITTTEPQRQVNHDDTITEPTQPTKENHKFIGWTLVENGTELYDFSTKVTGELTLYAKFEINKYSVTFVLEEGSNEVEAQEIAHGQTATEPQQPTKEGHTFKGWFKEQSYTTPFEFTTQITEETFIYGKFEINQYSVKFYNDTEVYETKTINWNEAIQLPNANPTKVGHTFKGWYTNQELTEKLDEATTKVTTDLNIYAKFVINEYTVTYEITDGELEDGVASTVKVEHGSTIQTAPQLKERELHSVQKWVYTVEGSSDQTDFEFGITKVEQNITIKPKWEQTYTYVNLDLQGGQFTEPVKVKVKLNKPFTKPTSQPTKEHYTFDKWVKTQDSDEEFEFETTNITAETTIYAKWNVVQYTLTFVVNGGQLGSSQEQTAKVNYNESLAQQPEATRDGYTLKHWTYQDGEETKVFEFGTTLVTKDLTLTALWQKTQITVTYVLKADDESKNKTKTIQVQERTPAVAEDLTEEEKNENANGSVFKHWINKATNEVFDLATELTDDITLQAVYYELTKLENFASQENNTKILTEGKIVAKLGTDKFIISVKEDSQEHSNHAVIVGVDSGTIENAEVGKKLRLLGKVIKSDEFEGLILEQNAFTNVSEDTTAEHTFANFASDMASQDTTSYKILNLQNALFLQALEHDKYLVRVDGVEVIVSTTDKTTFTTQNRLYNLEKLLLLSKVEEKLHFGIIPNFSDVTKQQTTDFTISVDGEATIKKGETKTLTITQTPENTEEQDIQVSLKGESAGFTLSEVQEQKNKRTLSYDGDKTEGIVTVEVVMGGVTKEITLTILPAENNEQPTPDPTSNVMYDELTLKFKKNSSAYNAYTFEFVNDDDSINVKTTNSHIHDKILEMVATAKNNNKVSTATFEIQKNEKMSKFILKANIRFQNTANDKLDTAFIEFFEEGSNTATFKYDLSATKGGSKVIDNIEIEIPENKQKVYKQVKVTLNLNGDQTNNNTKIKIHSIKIEKKVE